MHKIGRNDPCPCGSGKKYKKCCLRNAAASIGNLGWRKLRRAEDTVFTKLSRLLLTYYSEDACAEALDEFLCYADDPAMEECKTDINQFFPHWFLYNRIPHKCRDRCHRTPSRDAVRPILPAGKGPDVDTLRESLGLVS